MLSTLGVSDCLLSILHQLVLEAGFLLVRQNFKSFLLCIPGAQSREFDDNHSPLEPRATFF